MFENGKWRISHINKDFKEIETYPELIVVPASIPDAVLRDATSFRSIGRIPSLCWLNKANGATLTRSSQPKVRSERMGLEFPSRWSASTFICLLLCRLAHFQVGMSKATSPADESLVAAIAGSSLLRDFLHIIDCRPMTNALVTCACNMKRVCASSISQCVCVFVPCLRCWCVRRIERKGMALKAQ